jgi:hypothetical protein
MEWTRSSKPNMLSRCGTKRFHQIGGICRFLALITPPREKIKPYPVRTPRLTPSPLPFLEAHGRNWPTVELELAGDRGLEPGRRTGDGGGPASSGGRQAGGWRHPGKRAGGDRGSGAVGKACSGRWRAGKRRQAANSWESVDKGPESINDDMNW